jgi:hypothetical protein
MEEKRVVGNRRSEQELESLKIELNKLTYVLSEQTDFVGTQEQLERMQSLERAYINGTPMVSDEEWDLLKSVHHYRESLVSVAPSGRSWVKMLAPLPSINKAGTMQELDAFLDKFSSDESFKIECKMDGLTANVRYKLDDDMLSYHFDCITSRGNGRYGLMLNPHALDGVKTNYPKSIDTKIVMKILNVQKIGSLPKYFELRGEAVLKKNQHNFDKYGKNAVWCSVASGMFNRKVPGNLKGLCMYLFGKSEEELTATGGFDIPELEQARLIASLSNDTNRFLRKDHVRLLGDGLMEIYHANGDIFKYHDDGEELDFVFYSVAVDNANIDHDAIAEIPGLKHISQVQFADKFKDELDKLGIPTLYRVVNSKDAIHQAVAEFYGTDLDGKRDFSKPRTRNMYEYAIDGVVIKPLNSNGSTQGLDFRNSRSNASKIVCPEYPEDQIAVKLLSERVKVKLERIERSKTSLGNVTCSGILDKPYRTESGRMVSNINLHNPEWLADNSWIQEGHEYEMVMAMDIIPTLLNPNDLI